MANNIPLKVTDNSIGVHLTVSSDSRRIGMDVDIGHPVATNPYDGAYDVTPRVYAQTLETQGKSMSDDVTVYEIPVTSTSNPQGGLTVLIG